METVTSRLQRRVEEDAAELYGRLLRATGSVAGEQQQQEGEQPPAPPVLPPPLAADAHARFLAAALGPLPAGFASLDASRCWIVYWALHGLALLGKGPMSGGLEDSEEEEDEEEEEEGGGNDDDDDDDGATAAPPPAHRRPSAARRPPRVRLGGARARPGPNKQQQQPPQQQQIPSPSPPKEEIAAFLASCQAPSGGFGGGPYQRPHLAPTYAAVAALVTLGSDEALRVIDRPGLRAFLLRCADEARLRQGGVGAETGGGAATIPAGNADDNTGGGGFAMHEGGGEVDARSCYTALAAAELAGLDVLEIAARAGASVFLSRCQTYEGGCGGEPGNEAHGGYTYCCAAAAGILRRAAERVGDERAALEAARAVDARSAVRWASWRQMRVEGGFSGRANKLADGCYSFWVGGLFPVLRAQMAWLEEADGRGGGEDSDSRAAAELELAAMVAAVPPLPRSVLERRASAPAAAARRAAGLAKQRAGEATAAVLRMAAGGGRAGGDNEEEEEDEGDDAGANAALLARAARAQAAEARAAADLRLAERSAAVLAGAALPPTPSGPPSSARSPPAATCNARALALWVLLACQPAAAGALLLGGGSDADAAIARATSGGGLRDKPGKPPDFYHTCYCLSALALLDPGDSGGLSLPRTDPLLNVLADRAEAARAFFSSLAGGGGGG
jgi:protein farnesyltransferase subunit beta